MPKRDAEVRSSGERPEKKAKVDGEEMEALKALVARHEAENAAQKQALAAQAAALQAKDETIATQAAENTTLQQSIASASAAAFASPLLRGRARTGNECKAHAHGLLAVVERLSDPSKAGLARCHALRSKLAQNRGECIAALKVEHDNALDDVTRALQHKLANQIVSIDANLRRMRRSIDLQQMPLQNMIKQVDAAESLANTALASASAASFGCRLAKSTSSFLLTDPDRALPKIHNTLSVLEKTMKIEIDGAAWPRARAAATQGLGHAIAGMVKAHGVRHPIVEIQQWPNVMRRIMALVAPTAMSRRAERQQWASKLLALQPVIHKLPTLVSTIAAAPQASSTAAAAGSAAAPIALDDAAVASSAATNTATQSLSLVNVIAKDFLDKFTHHTTPSAKWAAKANPWLAMAVMQVRCVTLKGHTGRCAGLMGLYKLNEEHSTNGKSVYTNVVLSEVHLFRATNGRWCVSPTKHMIAGGLKCLFGSSTASDSFLDLTWKFTQVRGGALQDMLLQVAETTVGDRLSHADVMMRALAITTITVAGHTGPRIAGMGAYVRNPEHSPMNGGNVYTKTDKIANCNVHLYRGMNGENVHRQQIWCNHFHHTVALAA